MKYRLGELIESVSKTYDLKNKKSVTFVNTGDVFDGSISGNETKIKDLPGQAKKSIELNDILFSEIRPKNKRFALVTGIDPKNYVVSTKLMVLRNKNNLVLDTNYLYFYLTSPLMLAYFQSEAESRSGTFPQITFRENVANIKIDLPPLIEQRKIVQRLSVVNDKVKLNNQINDNLDALLTNIFKKYMINDDFEKSDLTQIANYKNGLAMQKYRPNSNEESLPVLKIKELNQGNTDDSSDRCSANLDNSVIVNTGDIIFSWSGTLLVKNWTGDKAGLNQHLFKVTSNKYPAWFIYEWTKYHLLRFQAIAAGKATTMGHIKRSDLKSSLVYIPSQLFLAKMDSQLAPIYSQRLNLIKENQQLSKLKQTLLKKYF